MPLSDLPQRQYKSHSHCPLSQFLDLYFLSPCLPFLLSVDVLLMFSLNRTRWWSLPISAPLTTFTSHTCSAGLSHKVMNEGLQTAAFTLPGALMVCLVLESRVDHHKLVEVQNSSSLNPVPFTSRCVITILSFTYISFTYHHRAQKCRSLSVNGTTIPTLALPQWMPK